MGRGWMTPEELRAVADYCEVLSPLWEGSNEPGAVLVETSAMELDVYDSNGSKLGTIAPSVEGAAFYPRASNTRRESSGRFS